MSKRLRGENVVVELTPDDILTIRVALAERATKQQCSVEAGSGPALQARMKADRLWDKLTPVMKNCLVGVKLELSVKQEEVG